MGPVSSLMSPSVDTVAIGLVSSVVVYPVYLAVLFLFRMSRSKAFSGQVKNDLFLEDAKSLVCWPSSEGTLSWPDLLSDPSVMSSTLQRLAQGRPGCMLGSEEDGASLVSPSLPAKYLSASDEDLIHQVLADGANNPDPTQDALIERDLLTSLSSAPGEKTETLILQTMGEKRPPSMGLTWEQSPVTRLSRTGTPTQSRTFLPGLPGLAAMQLSVCLQGWWKVFGRGCCLPGALRWPMGSAYSW